MNNQKIKFIKIKFLIIILIRIIIIKTLFNKLVQKNRENKVMILKVHQIKNLKFHKTPIQTPHLN